MKTSYGSFPPEFHKLNNNCALEFWCCAHVLVETEEEAKGKGGDPHRTDSWALLPAMEGFSDRSKTYLMWHNFDTEHEERREAVYVWWRSSLLAMMIMVTKLHTRQYTDWWMSDVLPSTPDDIFEKKEKKNICFSWNYFGNCIFAGNFNEC